MKSLELLGTKSRSPSKSNESQNTNKFILIDMNNLCHIAHYATGHLTNDEDRHTGVIFGVFKQLLHLTKKFDSNNFICFWDSRLSFRKQFFPEYKEQRKKQRTEEQEENRRLLYEQISLLRSKIIPEIGIKNSFVATGYEADDLIAKFILDNYNEIKTFVIVSTDQDLFQLLRKNVFIYNIVKKTMMTEEIFKEEWDGLPPINYRLIKAIAGCHSDNIPPIERGIGEKTALKYLLGKGDDNLNNRIWTNNLNKERNFKLVALPFTHAKKPLPILPYNKNKIDYQNLRKWFNFLGFNYFLNNFNEWEKFIGNSNN